MLLHFLDDLADRGLADAKLLCGGRHGALVTDFDEYLKIPYGHGHTSHSFIVDNHIILKGLSQYSISSAYVYFKKNLLIIQATIVSPNMGLLLSVTQI